MRPVLLVGAQGNMGARYKSILDYLSIPVRGVDKENSKEEIKSVARDCSGIIIATPTDTHCELIKLLAEKNKPILCEKPITKDLQVLRHTLDYVQAVEGSLTMVYQYSMLNPPASIGPTYYNYFKHGNDGLVWDCIQIIGLARGPVRVASDSPVWSCRLNGRTLRLGDMDAAYIAYMQRWLANPGQSLSEIFSIHKKTQEFAKTVANG